MLRLGLNRERKRERERESPFILDRHTIGNFGWLLFVGSLSSYNVLLRCLNAAL